MINDMTYWSLYTASAKKIAKRTGQPIQTVLRNAQLIWSMYKVLPHLGLALYWAGCQGKEHRILHHPSRLH